MEQLLFDFMNEYVTQVIPFDYIGGQDEELGGYCEPLEIKYNSGPSDFILHDMYQARQVDRSILNNHRKIRFFSKEDLMKKWRSYKNFNFPKECEWEKTDVSCGYNTEIFSLRYGMVV